MLFVKVKMRLFAAKERDVCNMKRGNGWNQLFVSSIVVALAGLCLSGLTIYKYIGRAPVLDTAATAAIEPTQLEQVVMPTVSAANWQPKARPLGGSAALADSLNKTGIEPLVEKGFRSVILPNTFTDFTPQEALQAKRVLDYLGGLGIFRTLTVEPVEEKDFPAFALALSKLIEYTSFDALLVQNPSEGAEDTMAKFMDMLGGILSDAELNSIPVSFEIPASITANLNENEKGYLGEHLESIKQLAGTLAKPEFVVPATLEQVSQWPQIAQALGMEADPLTTAVVDLKDAIPNGTLEETIQFLSTLGSLKDAALAFSKADFVPENLQAAKLLGQFINDDLDVTSLNRTFTLMSPLKSILKSEQTIRTEQPNINFSGGSNPLFALLCNGKDVARNESGDFCADFLLKPGKNIFKFIHQGLTYIINVFYDPVILRDVAPKSPIETTGGIDLGVSVVARKGADVRASLNNIHISLKPGACVEEDGANASDDADSDFITYVGAFQLPTTNQTRSLGSIVYSATYQGKPEWKTGVKVTLLPDISVPDPPLPSEPTTGTTSPSSETSAGTVPPPSSETSSGTIPPPSSETSSGTIPPLSSETSSGTIPPPSSETSSGTVPPPPSSETTTSAATTTIAIPADDLFTPDKNHGLGKAQMVRVTTSYANSHWAGGTDTRSNPTASPLLAGTYDYVAGMTKSGSYTYYALASGKRVESKDVEVIASGYRLPLNELVAQSAVGNGALVLRFGTKWKVPFNVNLIGQNYTSAFGYSGYPHGVSNFNATGIEITFYHTKSYTGSVNVSGSALFSSAEWSRDTAKNTITLKLMFRNAGKFYGYRAYYEGNQLVFRLRQKPPTGLSGAVIYLDPGHGGADPGARLVASHATLTREKHVNLQIAMKLKAKLEAKGATVHITRTGDSAYSLQQRTDKARQANPDLFISLHCDSSEKASPMGTTAFYYRAYGQPLAKAVQNRVAEAWKNQIYTKSNYSDYLTLQSKVNRGAYFYPFEVTRIEECPAILVEYGFGSNLTECRALQKDQNQDILAQATLAGIEDYLKAAQ